MIFNMVGGGSSNPFAMVLVNYPQNSTLTATNVDGYKDIFPSSSTNPQRLYYVSEPSGETQTCVFTITDGTQTATKTVSNIDLASTRNVTLSYRVPSGYQEVEYLQGTGTQWISTTVQNNSNIDFVLVARSDGLNTAKSMSGTTVNGDISRTLAIGCRYPSNTLMLETGDSYSRIDYDETTFHTYYYLNSQSGSKIDNGSLVSFSGYNNPNGLLCLFGTTVVGSTSILDIAKCSVKSCLIYQNGVLIREFIPCYRTEDNVAGMWERVNEVFYTNNGSGTFIVGGDVN